MRLAAFKALTALALAFLAASCFTTTATRTPDGLSVISEDRTIGDFDGDHRSDIAGWFETNEGALVVAVYRAAGGAPLTLWGGDISSVPYFTLSAAGPGTYHTDCEAYDGCAGKAPEQVTLTHDGLIVRGTDDGSITLYYWDGATFQNVSIRE